MGHYYNQGDPGFLVLASPAVRRGGGGEQHGGGGAGGNAAARHKQDQRWVVSKNVGIGIDYFCDSMAKNGTCEALRTVALRRLLNSFFLFSM